MSIDHDRTQNFSFYSEILSPKYVYVQLWYIGFLFRAPGHLETILIPRGKSTKNCGIPALYVQLHPV